MTRTETRTEKLKTDFGSVYLHADHDGSKIIQVWVSAPQKLENSQVGNLIEQLMHGMNRIIKPVSEMNEEERIELVQRILEEVGPR